jgi:hypothetical protein
MASRRGQAVNESERLSIRRGRNSEWTETRTLFWPRLCIGPLPRFHEEYFKARYHLSQAVLTNVMLAQT